MKTGTDVNAAIRLARRIWGNLSREACLVLVETIRNYKFSLANGDLLFLNSHWYVTHTGLLGLARRSRCAGIHVKPISRFCEPSTQHWSFMATVYKSRTCKGFMGYGDADPSNVSYLVHGAEMRVAETRAVNRALRKAYGIGICSVEEIGSNPEPVQEHKKLSRQSANGNGNGRTVRDHLCQIIRQYQLDPNLVKAYATESCGVKTLREATREQIEAFVAQLAEWAEKDLDALRCQLNSYLGQKEVVA